MTYVTYFRTSTKKQDLGIESQKGMVLGSVQKVIGITSLIPNRGFF